MTTPTLGLDMDLEPGPNGPLKEGQMDYVSTRVFEGTRPLSGKTADALRAMHARHNEQFTSLNDAKRSGSP